MKGAVPLSFASLLVAIGCTPEPNCTRYVDNMPVIYGNYSEAFGTAHDDPRAVGLERCQQMLRDRPREYGPYISCMQQARNVEDADQCRRELAARGEEMRGE